ncbi:hypothetical protein ACGFXB_16505 [Streptomyces canus]|uniref:hypothetical protein n=1 Tax=Streptomyces canus TaxID=58343 RepID=UPI0037170587
MPFTSVHDGAQDRPADSVTGWSGRTLVPAHGPLSADRRLALRWLYATNRLYVGRGAYVDGLRVGTGDCVLFDESRPADGARIEAVGWTASGD